MRQININREVREANDFIEKHLVTQHIAIIKFYALYNKMSFGILESVWDKLK